MDLISPGASAFRNEKRRLYYGQESVFISGYDHVSTERKESQLSAQKRKSDRKRERKRERSRKTTTVKDKERRVLNLACGTNSVVRFLLLKTKSCKFPKAQEINVRIL